MIREFFVNENPTFIYKPFGIFHCLLITIALLTAIFIYINRNRISKIPKKKSMTILRICVAILFINMFIYTFGNLYFGSFNYKEMLPFHLCFIANYMFMFGILLKKESILKLTLFISFIGPIPAILWPDLVSTIDNFNFWQLIISHHFFLNVSLFSYYALNYRIGIKDYIKVIILINILLLITIPFNNYFDTNYIFTNHIPENVIELYPFLTKIPTLLVLEVVGFAISYLIYRLIIIPRNKELDKNNLQ